jgi:hypothetical protein
MPENRTVFFIPLRLAFRGLRMDLAWRGAVVFTACTSAFGFFL